MKNLGQIKDNREEIREERLKFGRKEDGIGCTISELWR